MVDASLPRTTPNTPGEWRRSPPHEGRSLGGFHIGREIACGGMGRVYLAHRTQGIGGGEAVAVKVIHPHLAREQEFINMFLDEARIASSIRHPSVCRVLDYGKADGTYYMAMEYVMGESMAHVMRRLRTSSEAARIAEPLLKQAAYQACEALHAVHHAVDAEGKPLGIVHRDISPQNMMIGYDGRVRLLDFGVAQASERLQVTRTGVVKGRLAYMAPEQMRGMRVDQRADVWSVGVVLWEALSGRRLFKRETEVQTVQAVTRDPIPPVANPSQPVSESLQRVLARALQRDPACRYASAQEFGMALVDDSSSPQASVSQLSDWMKALFADSVVHKQQLVAESARAAGADKPLEETMRAVSDDVDDDAPTLVNLRIPRGLRDGGKSHGVAPTDAQQSESGTLRPVEQPRQTQPHSSRHVPITITPVIRPPLYSISAAYPACDDNEPDCSRCRWPRPAAP